jgi:uncharacterized protein (DUF1810 family)
MEDSLERFVVAQAGVYATVQAELRAGRKRTHWMWFVFPQLRGLGSSALAHTYGLASLTEARDYLDHPLLSPRLHDCTELVLATRERSLTQIFGTPDDLKFRSSMTLFTLAANEANAPFERALQRYCDGRLDDRTVALARP